MTRRATKKMLRRAEQAFMERRYQSAEQIYRELIDGFVFASPSLLDYAACIFGLIRTLYATERDAEAHMLADSAFMALAESPTEVAA